MSLFLIVATLVFIYCTTKWAVGKPLLGATVGIIISAIALTAFFVISPDFSTSYYESSSPVTVTNVDGAISHVQRTMQVEGSTETYRVNRTATINEGDTGYLTCYQFGSRTSDITCSIRR